MKRTDLIKNITSLNISANVVLVAVTKDRSIDEIQQIIDADIKHIGENKIQEAEEKLLLIKKNNPNTTLIKHFIGHLQSNKIKKAVELFDVIQSVDSIKLAEKINSEAEKQSKQIKIMLQINIGNEQQKHGFKKEDAEDAYKKIFALKNIIIHGIMCIGPLDKDPTSFFQQMKKLKDKLHVEHLSMGMSDDYRIAIQEGSTMIRIGRRLFCCS